MNGVGSALAGQLAPVHPGQPHELAGHWPRTAVVDTHWALDHLHVSHPLPNTEIAGFAIAFPTLPAVGESVAPGGGELVSLMQNNFDCGRQTLFAASHDVVFIGTNWGECWGHGASNDAPPDRPSAAQPREQSKPGS